MERHADGPAGDGDRRHGGIGAVRQHHGHAIPGAETEPAQLGDDLGRPLPQAAIGQCDSIGRQNGEAIRLDPSVMGEGIGQ